MFCRSIMIFIGARFARGNKDFQKDRFGIRTRYRRLQYQAVATTPFNQLSAWRLGRNVLYQLPWRNASRILEVFPYFANISFAAYVENNDLSARGKSPNKPLDFSVKSPYRHEPMPWNTDLRYHQMCVVVEQLYDAFVFNSHMCIIQYLSSFCKAKRE